MQDSTSRVRPLRPPQDNIPQTKQQRRRLLEVVAEYVEREHPVGPLSLDELRRHSRAVIKAANTDPKYIDFIAILVDNEIWRPTVEGIAYNKRLLLLPKCLRSDKCSAGFDEFGLVCEHCGRCLIDEFKSQAEQLGYTVLVAEGSPVVMSLIETGRVEAVVGVSCMSVLEQVFPYTEAAAIPGIAIPLLQDGCANTTVDVDWVWDAIYQTGQDRTNRLNLEELRKEVDRLFCAESVKSTMGWGDSQTETLALEWLAGAGKRWRPFLAVCAYQAVAENNEQRLGEDLRKAAMAVECFHKASLIHDDIEDDDDLRYGEKTLHAEYGVPIALNVGDFLLGEGYRLLSELKTAPKRRTAMLRVAARGHRDLCLGQGSELSWLRRPGPLSVTQVIDIFEKKTSPAFEVALKLGAILGGGCDEVGKVLRQYSRSLGVAYQIRDDIDDLHLRESCVATSPTRPSLLPALAYEMAGDNDKKLLESIRRGHVESDKGQEKIASIFARLKVEQAALNLVESHKARAIGALGRLKNAALKGLLRRVVGKIFNNIEVMGCCNEYKVGHARSLESGEASAG